MELRHLRYFQAVARDGSFTLASSSLHVAQPALTRQIQNLETELGARLLVRSARGVDLTPAGRVFLEGARSVLTGTDDAVRQAAQVRTGEHGQCRLGVGRLALATAIVSKIIVSLQRDFTGVHLELIELFPREQWDALLRGELDLGLGVAPFPCGASIICDRIFDLPIECALVAADGPFAARSSLHVGDLGSLPVLAFAPDEHPVVHAALTRALDEADVKSPREFTHSSVSALWAAVAAGSGWTPVSRVWAPTSGEGTVAVPLDGLNLSLPYSLMSRVGDRRSLVATLRGAIRTYARVAVAEMAETPSGAPSHSRRERKAARAGNGGEVDTSAQGIELRHLRSFASVLDRQSIGSAARELGLTQPALSRQMRDLEHQVGVRLLERSAHGVGATPAGELFRGEAQRILTVVRRLVAETRRAQRGADRRCILGCIPTPQVLDLVSQALRDCAALEPRIEVRVRELPSPLQPQALREGEIDVAIGHPYVEVAGDLRLGHERLVHDTMDRALLAERHTLARSASIEISALRDVPFLFVPREFYPLLYDRVFVEFEELGFSPLVNRAYEGLHTIWALAAEGVGWTLATRWQAERLPAGTVAVPLVGFELEWGLDVLWRRDRVNASVEPVLDALRRARALVPLA